MTDEPEVEASVGAAVGRDVPFTEAEIASVEADDGKEHLLPLHIRRAIAGTMREQNASAERWRRNLAILRHEADTPMRGHDPDGACCRAAQEDA